MKIHEYQAKEILRRYGVPTPRGTVTDDAAIALKILANYHAAHWMDQELIEENPVFMGLDTAPKIFQASYRRNRDDFVNRFGEMVGPEMVARMDSVSPR